MSWKFNPFTATLDYYNQFCPYYIKQLVDSSFLLSPEIETGVTPNPSSILMTLNGLEIDDTNYTISGTKIIVLVLQLKLGDNIYIHLTD